MNDHVCSTTAAAFTMALDSLQGQLSAQGQQLAAAKAELETTKAALKSESALKESALRRLAATFPDGLIPAEKGTVQRDG